MAKGYSVERFTRIYSDDHGYFWEIRPDSDGLGCVEIRYFEEPGVGSPLLTVSPTAARLIADAMCLVAGQVEGIND